MAFLPTPSSYRRTVIHAGLGPPGLLPAAQRERGFYNAEIPAPALRKLCALDESGERRLEMAVRRMGLSARAHDRVLKLARTVVDWTGPRD